MSRGHPARLTEPWHARTAEAVGAVVGFIMADLISEPIQPRAGTFDTASMARGEPGLPKGFEWRGRSFEIVEELKRWKESSREGARTGGDLYLRRHYFRLRMSDGSEWTVYFVRQTPRVGNAKRRWFLYTIERG